MKRSTMITTLAILAGLFVTPTMQAQGSGGGSIGSAARQPQSYGFSVRERQIVAEYFATNVEEVEELPPVIAGFLVRGRRLPPGVSKIPIPAGLREQYPIRAGYEVAIFGDRIVLLDANGLVVDIIEGIFD